MGVPIHGGPYARGSPIQEGPLPAEVPIHGGPYNILQPVSLYMGVPTHGKLYTRGTLYMGVPTYGDPYTWGLLYMGIPIHGVPMHGGRYTPIQPTHVPIHGSLYSWETLRVYMGVPIYGEPYAWGSLYMGTPDREIPDVLTCSVKSWSPFLFTICSTATTFPPLLD